MGRDNQMKTLYMTFVQICGKKQNPDLNGKWAEILENDLYKASDSAVNKIYRTKAGQLLRNLKKLDKDEVEKIMKNGETAFNEFIGEYEQKPKVVHKPVLQPVMRPPAISRNITQPPISHAVTQNEGNIKDVSSTSKNNINYDNAIDTNKQDSELERENSKINIKLDEEPTIKTTDVINNENKIKPTDEVENEYKNENVSKLSAEDLNKSELIHKEKINMKEKIIKENEDDIDADANTKIEDNKNMDISKSIKEKEDNKKINIKKETKEVPNCINTNEEIKETITNNPSNVEEEQNDIDMSDDTWGLKQTADLDPAHNNEKIILDDTKDIKNEAITTQNDVIEEDKKTPNITETKSNCKEIIENSSITNEDENKKNELPINPTSSFQPAEEIKGSKLFEANVTNKDELWDLYKKLRKELDLNKHKLHKTNNEVNFCNLNSYNSYDKGRIIK